MPVRSVSAAELRVLVAEIAARRGHAIDAEALEILPKDHGWWAALRRDGERLDEAAHAAVAEACLRVSRGFALDQATV
jgi:hypothetical protein